MTRDESHLISRLEEGSKQKVKTGKTYRKDYDVWDVPGLTITRWKFNEWDYYSEKVVLPTYARGLFTLGADRILLRGYNKFFNIDEVKATKLDALREETTGPYHATVKENGSLVLISGFDGRLVVTSKNASGPSGTVAGRSHPKVARQWVLKHLESRGKTEEELANFLESNQWTAVGELCDDQFEEHVLAYPPSKAGIYLTGLNTCSGEFQTQPPAIVQEVGNTFGFLQTDFKTFESLTDLFEFLEDGQKTGKWHEREVEGFVIRCKRDGQDFFFKFKFEEPYLMYRNWREVVKKYITHDLVAAAAMAKRSKHAESSLRFLAFARQHLTAHPELRDKIVHENLGIIEMRNNFFERTGLDEEELLSLGMNSSPRWLLVPAATIGVGKSSTSEALVHLMNGEWAHEQNDDMKKGKSKGANKWTSLVSRIWADFPDHQAVILDRNNSSYDERKQIFAEFDQNAGVYGYDIKYVCLNFLPIGPTEQTRRLTRERVIARGDSHQTIKLSKLSESGVNGIMAQFEHRFDVVNPRVFPDDSFDLVIDLVPGDSKGNVMKIITAMRKKYGDMLSLPTIDNGDIEKVVEQALAPKTELASDDVKQKVKQPKPKANFFAVRVDSKGYEALVTILKSTVDSEVLKSVNIQDEFHVTIAHRIGHEKEFSELLKRYGDQIKTIPQFLDPKFTVNVTKLAWKDDMVAFNAEVEGSANGDRAHITVGTAAGVPAKDSKQLFEGLAEKIVDLPSPLTLEGQRLYASR